MKNITSVTEDSVVEDLSIKECVLFLWQKIPVRNAWRNYLCDRRALAYFLMTTLTLTLANIMKLSLTVTNPITPNLTSTLVMPDDRKYELLDDSSLKNMVIPDSDLFYVFLHPYVRRINNRSFYVFVLLPHYRGLKIHVECETLWSIVGLLSGLVWTMLLPTFFHILYFHRCTSAKQMLPTHVFPHLPQAFPQFFFKEYNPGPTTQRVDCGSSFIRTTHFLAPPLLTRSDTLLANVLLSL